MAAPGPSDAMVPVERAELVTQDVDQLTELVRHLYVEHEPAFRCADPSRVDGGLRAATVGALTAGAVQYVGLDCTAQVSPLPVPIAVTLSRGAGTVATSREERSFTAGDVIMGPTELPSTATFSDAGYLTMQVGWDALRSLAESGGVPAASLRFEGMAAVSVTAQRLFADTMAFSYRQLITSGVAEIHPVLAAELTRLAAAIMLETFPNTTMTASHVREPGWVAPAAARRAAAFMDAHADEPVTLDQIAAAAEVTGRALQYAFRGHYNLTPIGYLRQVRLTHAHAELQAADPGGSVTVTAVARRWGWATPGQFARAYRQRFGELPSRTLRH